MKKERKELREGGREGGGKVHCRKEGSGEGRREEERKKGG